MTEQEGIDLLVALADDLRNTGRPERGRIVREAAERIAALERRLQLMRSHWSDAEDHVTDAEDSLADAREALAWELNILEVEVKPVVVASRRDWLNTRIAKLRATLSRLTPNKGVTDDNA